MGVHCSLHFALFTLCFEPIGVIVGRRRQVVQVQVHRHATCLMEVVVFMLGVFAIGIGAVAVTVATALIQNGDIGVTVPPRQLDVTLVSYHGNGKGCVDATTDVPLISDGMACCIVLHRIASTGGWGGRERERERLIS